MNNQYEKNDSVNHNDQMGHEGQPSKKPEGQKPEHSGQAGSNQKHSSSADWSDSNKESQGKW